jgi:hypothetical protein
VVSACIRPLVDDHLVRFTHNRYCWLWLLCLCTAVGVNLDMSGVLLGEGLLCLLWGPVWVRLSPLLGLGYLYFCGVGLYAGVVCYLPILYWSVPGFLLCSLAWCCYLQLGMLYFLQLAGLVAAAVSLPEMLADDWGWWLVLLVIAMCLGVLDWWSYCRWRLLQDGNVWSPTAKDFFACLGEALSPNVWPSPCSPYELLVLAGWSGIPSW